MESKTFTMEDALKVQLQDLSQWAVVLKHEVYTKLLEYTLEHNKSVNNPYDVFRGVSITNWVREYASKHA